MCGVCNNQVLDGLKNGKVNWENMATLGDVFASPLGSKLCQKMSWEISWSRKDDAIILTLLQEEAARSNPIFRESDICHGLFAQLREGGNSLKRRQSSTQQQQRCVQNCLSLFKKVQISKTISN